MGQFPMTNQTRLMGIILDGTLLTRSLMKLHERRPEMSFFSASKILVQHRCKETRSYTPDSYRHGTS